MNKNNKKSPTPYKYKYHSMNRPVVVEVKGRKSSHRDQRSSRRVSFVAVFGSLFLIFVVFMFTNHAKARSLDDLAKAISSLSDNTKQKPHPAKTISLAAMNSAVNGVISKNSDIDFEVAVTDLNNGSQLSFGQSGPMTAASVSKVMTATDFLSQVELGNESLGETLEDGNTAGYDLQQMIVVSDDTSWDSLNDELGYTQLQSYANNIGLSSYDYETNTLSAQDTATLFSELYQGKLLNHSDTQLLLGYMQQANYRNLIIPAVPSSDTVYHKVGEYDDNVNDAAIITNGKQTIVLVIFTNGNGIYDWSDRATMIQSITTPILEYFNLD